MVGKSMPQTQEKLDRLLDRQHTIRVNVSLDHPLPVSNAAYAHLIPLEQTGFTFTPRELIHAIGCKTAALPSNSHDECIKAALLYTFVLDLEGAYLTFRGDFGADLQTARSQEVGIGFTCLIAERYFGIPWDQLGPIPGQGKRFDYRGAGNGFDCIFEAKGTSYLHNQSSQIEDGIEKKNVIHQAGDHFDVELIISTYIGRRNGAPRISLADPDKSSLKEAFNRGDERYYRLKHYCRVLQFIGLPESAYRLNLYAQAYLNKRLSVYKTVMDEKTRMGFLSSVIVDDDEFFGRWFSYWLPENSKRYKNLLNKEKQQKPIWEASRARRVFQGVRRDIFESGFGIKPFSHMLLSKQETNRYAKFEQSGVSVFPDGTIMIFEQK
jgi:hypothetical protein